MNNNSLTIDKKSTSVPVMKYFLVPDSSAARRVRRVLAENSACSGIVVGTWNELVVFAENAYLIPVRNDDWDEIFHTALGEMTGAFWAQSFQVSPSRTAAAIEVALCQIVSASDPRLPLADAGSEQLPERTRKQVRDLTLLVAALEGALPHSLLAIRELLSADANIAVQHIHVQCIDDVLALTRWQRSLIEKLQCDAGSPVDTQATAVLQGILAATGRSDVSSSLAALQTDLFLHSDKRRTLDRSVQWVGVRDFLEEAEVAANLVQTMLGEHNDLTAADIGLLLPDNIEYPAAVSDAFGLAGLAVAGLPIDRWQRDLGCEAVSHFLYCQQKPAPAMALAACLSSPLMPWPDETGVAHAQKVMSGDYRLRSFNTTDKKSRAMLNLIRSGGENPQALMQALRSFVSLLDGGDQHAAHVYRAKSTVDRLCELLENREDVDWAVLRSVANTQTIKAVESPDFNLEGITIWREGHEPWRPVKQLIVLGFSTGNYPAVSKASSVFVADDLRAISEKMKLEISTPGDGQMRHRARFKRQLSAASDHVTFLIPRRNSAGVKQAPSETLVFMQQLFETEDTIILDLDASEDRKCVHYLTQAAACEPQSPRALIARDIRFDMDLLFLGAGSEGNQKPESPSSLEILMVSPLAWLLRRLGAEPLGWAPEAANVILLGILSHEVFDQLFPKGKPLTENDAIANDVPALLDDAIHQHGPFLKGLQWQGERRDLIAGIVRAALAWRGVLQTLGAEVLAGEEWLAGTLGGVALHGKADVLLGLPDNRLLIVDYKRSSAGSRKPRMQKGYDSQASLYRTMLQTGGLKDNDELNSRLAKIAQTGVVYFMMNDQASLSDSALMQSGGIPGWEVMDGDIASHALALIKKRLSEVQEGLLCLNREGDAAFFDKQAGIKPYALNASPLIPLFTIPGETEETG